MSQSVLLDASAVLAYLQGEPGSAAVEKALQAQQCSVTAANQAEIIAKSLDRGVTAEAIQIILAELPYAVVDVLAQDGLQAGMMRATTRTLGLSLGDRLCLAVAQRKKAAVFSADRPWLALRGPLNLDIVIIRPESH